MPYLNGTWVPKNYNSRYADAYLYYLGLTKDENKARELTRKELRGEC